VNAVPFDPTVDGAALVLGYLLGSIPFGLVLTRLAGLGDIRTIGSGNIGATNVLRTGRKGLAAATLILDSGKGAAAAVAAMILLGPTAALWAGLGAVIGHNFPVWLGFKGGKGVATTLGVLIACAWPVGLAACAAWLAAAAAFRMSSLAALIALSASPFFAWYLTAEPLKGPTAGLGAALALLSIVRHRANIARILKGEEPTISFSRKNKA
jgi:glycerol-3-phosphate acyltransferase PlsY